MLIILSISFNIFISFTMLRNLISIFTVEYQHKNNNEDFSLNKSINGTKSFDKAKMNWLKTLTFSYIFY